MQYLAFMESLPCSRHFDMQIEEEVWLEEEEGNEGRKRLKKLPDYDLQLRSALTHTHVVFVDKPNCHANGFGPL